MAVVRVGRDCARLTGGFGFGAAAFLWPPATACWAELTEAHGHLQLFGWGGLMVLGVGLFFLPRLRGAPLAAPSLVLPALLLLSGRGWAIRLATALACGSGPASRAGAQPLAGSFELGGAGLGVAALARTARRGPHPPRQGRIVAGSALPGAGVHFAAAGTRGQSGATGGKPH